MTTIPDGFEERYEGTYELRLEGEFGFFIRLTVTDAMGEPREKPLVELALPHQCDSWDIADNEYKTLEKAVADADLFVQEAQAAANALHRVHLQMEQGWTSTSSH